MNERFTSYVLSGTSSDFTINYAPPLRLDPSKSYEAALLSIDLYNSFPNITHENNQLRYSTDNGVTWKDISVKTGSYELTNINDEISRLLKENGESEDTKPYFSVKPNLSTLKSIVEVTSEFLRIDLGTIGPTLGFPPHTILGIGYHESPDIVDIMKTTSILVNIDIISGSYVNGNRSPVIYSFFPDVPPGYKIVERPNPSLVYYPVNRFNIDRMRIWLTDQNNKSMDLRGESVTVRIAIRETFDLKREIREALTEQKLTNF
jgi:hypothetical protein